MGAGLIPEADDTPPGGVTPTSAALADATANPTTTLIGAPMEAFNGTTWDRVRSIAGALSSGKLTATGLLAAIIGGRYAATRPALADGEMSPMQMNVRGDVAVMEQYIPDAEDNANDVIWTENRPLATVAAGTVWLNYKSGAALIGTTPQAVKTSSGRLRSCVACAGAGATVDVYLVGLNVLVASAVSGTTTTEFAVPVTTQTTSWAASGNGLDFGVEGMAFSTAITLAISTTPHVWTAPPDPAFAIFARYY